MNKETAQQKLGEQIRRIRKEKNLSQEQLAHTIGKDQQSVQRLETGNINPSFFYLTEIAAGLGVPLKELFNDL